MNVVWRLMRMHLTRHKRALAAMFLLTAVVASAPYAFSMLGKWLVDEALQVTGPPKAPASAPAHGAASAKAGESASVEWKAKTTDEKLRLLLIFVAASLGLHVLTTGLSGLSELVNSRVVHRITFDLRTSVHDKLANLDMRHFDQEPVGQLMTRVLDDSAGIPGNLTQLVISFCTQVAMLVLGLALLFKLNPAMTWIALVTLPFYGLVCLLLLPRIRTNTEDIRQRVAAFNGFTMERLTNVATIKNYAQEERETAAFGSRLDDNLGVSRRQQRLNLCFNTLTTLITAAGTLAVLAYGFLNIKAGVMQLGEVLAFHQVTAQLFVPIAGLVGCTTVAQTLDVLGRRVLDVLDKPAPADHGVDVAPTAPFRGEIAFDHVCLQYAEGGPFALNDVSLTIPAGKTVCLVGPTGAGRSTLLVLLTRLYEPTSGEVRLDGEDVRRLPLPVIRAAVRHVPRTCQVFSGTLAENIAYGAPDADPREIEAVASQVGLDSLAAGHPDGYAVRVGRGGLTLDAPDLARLAVARALLTAPAVLAVDDVFAAVDEGVGRQLLAAMREALPQATILIVTSHVSICEQADLVVVMRKGQVLEAGPHETLVSRPGTYRRMCLRQIGMEAVGDPPDTAPTA